jgi:hypothetical protein
MSTALSTQTSNSGVSQGNQAIITRPGFSSADSYKLCHQLSEVFAASHLVPTLYRANRANCMIAISMASRMQMDPLTVMQNLYIIQGKPSFSSQFLIASWNACGRFSPIRYKWSEKRDACRAISKDLQTGEELAGTLVTMAMAKAEGWIDKTGSKWKTMPEQMLMYRAAAFLVRAYGAEIALGMSTTEEAEDVSGIRASDPTSGDMVKLAIAPVQADVVKIADVEVIESSLETAEVIEVQTEAASSSAGKVKAGDTVAPGVVAIVAEPTQETSIVGTTMEGEAPVSNETLSHLGELVKQINPPKDKWVATLQKKYGVSSAKDLNENQAQAVVKWAKAQVEKKQLDEWAQGAGQKREASQEAAPFQTT